MKTVTMIFVSLGFLLIINGCGSIPSTSYSAKENNGTTQQPLDGLTGSRLWNIEELANVMVEDLFAEQDGYALVSGTTLKYYLYNLHNVYDNLTKSFAWKGAFDTDSFFYAAIERYLDNIGYVTDYDSHRIIEPNRDLAASVIQLMYRYNSDTSLTFIVDDKGVISYYVVNSENGRGGHRTDMFIVKKIDN
ncbi:hypothetical protein FACS1894109_09300 [Spirochaetia bacterium]|nr:hypothetical protein FACS1894109_09300 [Spirochaetia bacterium]